MRSHLSLFRVFSHLYATHKISTCVYGGQATIEKHSSSNSPFYDAKNNNKSYELLTLAFDINKTLVRIIGILLEGFLRIFLLYMWYSICASCKLFQILIVLYNTRKSHTSLAFSPSANLIRTKRLSLEPGIVHTPNNDSINGDWMWELSQVGSSYERKSASDSFLKLVLLLRRL